MFYSNPLQKTNNNNKNNYKNKNKNDFFDSYILSRRVHESKIAPIYDYF